MTTAQIHICQCVSRLRDILTVTVLNNVQHLPDEGIASFTTVCDKLLASQNYTSEYCRQQYLKATPSADLYQTLSIV